MVISWVLTGAAMIFLSFRCMKSKGAMCDHLRISYSGVFWRSYSRIVFLNWRTEPPRCK